MFKIEMMSMMLEGDEDEVTHGDDVDLKESTIYIEWIVINPQTEPLPNIALSNIQGYKKGIYFSHLCCSTFYANI